MSSAPAVRKPEDLQRATRMYSRDRVHVPLPSPAAVDEQAIKDFRERGFIAVENIYSPEEVRQYLKAINDAIVNDKGPKEDESQMVYYEPGVQVDQLSLEDRILAVRKLYHFVNFAPLLKQASEHSNLVDVCRKLIGEDVVMSQDMALLKPPGGGVEKPWHQDTAYFAIQPPEAVIGTWIALDPATLDNGCMHAIPGTHKLGPQPHYHELDCQLPDDRIDVASDVAIPLKPGAAMFFSGLLYHGTPPNTSSSRRQALQFHFRAKSATDMSRETIIENFHDEKGFAGCQGWIGTLKPRPMSTRPARPSF